MKKIIYILVLTLLILSCDKIKSSKYSGTYIGESDIYAWNMNDGVTSDTVYTDTLDIVPEGDYLLIYWQKKTHIDSIQENVTNYESLGSDSYSVKFSNDSIYYNSHGGGQGGGGYYSFIGSKE